MSENLSQKEMLVRLMDRVDQIGSEQTHHHTYATGKLDSIETQALKTNGRVTKSEKEINVLKSEVRNAKTVYATLATVLSVAWAVITFIV